MAHQGGEHENIERRLSSASSSGSSVYYDSNSVEKKEENDGETTRRTNEEKEESGETTRRTNEEKEEGSGIDDGELEKFANVSEPSSDSEESSSDRDHDATSFQNVSFLQKRVQSLLRKWRQSSPNLRRWSFALTMVIVGGILTMRRRKNRKRLPPPAASSYRSAVAAPLSQLLAAADQGTIQKVLLGASEVFFQMTTNNNKKDGSSSNNDDKTVWKRAQLPPQHTAAFQNDLLLKLVNDNKNVEVATLPESLSSRILSLGLTTVLPMAYLVFLYKVYQNIIRNRDDNMHKDVASKAILKEKQTTTFADVAGLDSVVFEVQEVVDFLQNPTRFRTLLQQQQQKQRLPSSNEHNHNNNQTTTTTTTPMIRSVLLYGPSGMGKTLLARAVAGEASVDAFLACSASQFVEIYVGRGAGRVRNLFQEARSKALENYRRKHGKPSSNWYHDSMNYVTRTLGLDTRGKGDTSKGDTTSKKSCTAIIFMDELDALAKVRANSGNVTNDEREQTLNQLLCEMDGFDQHNDDDVTVVVLAATNRADCLDPAVLRRFDRKIHVGCPDAAGRQKILQVHARNFQIDNNDSATNIDWSKLASDQHTAHMSGADLKNLIQEAVVLAMRDVVVNGNSSTTNDESSQQRLVVQQHHLEHAARRIQDMKDDALKLRHYNNTHQRQPHPPFQPQR